jgi:hypothetical protein
MPLPLPQLSDPGSQPDSLLKDSTIWVLILLLFAGTIEFKLSKKLNNDSQLPSGNCAYSKSL